MPWGLLCQGGAGGDRVRRGGAEGTLLGRASAEGTFSHSAGEGGTRAKGLEEFFMEEGRAGQRSRGGTHVGVLRTGAGAAGVPRNMWPV